jgi:hypothetical protein
MWLDGDGWLTVEIGLSPSAIPYLP